MVSKQARCRLANHVGGWMGEFSAISLRLFTLIAGQGIISYPFQYALFHKACLDLLPSLAPHLSMMNFSTFAGVIPSFWEVLDEKGQ